jgi:hypothetical protein
MVDREAEPQRWRRLLTITLAQIALAGIFLMAYGFGKMLQIVSVVNGSVLNLQAAQDAADRRLQAQTQSLILWTKVLAGVSLLLLVVTVILLVVTIWPRR